METKENYGIDRISNNANRFIDSLITLKIHIPTVIKNKDLAKRVVAPFTNMV